MRGTRNLTLVLYLLSNVKPRSLTVSSKAPSAAILGEKSVVAQEAGADPLLRSLSLLA